MSPSSFLLVSLLCLCVFSGGFAQDDVSTDSTIDISEVTTDTTLVTEVSPPNCVCPVAPVTTTTTTTTTTARPGRPSFRPRPRPSRPSLRPTHLCGNDGQNYTTICDFVNAQGNNEDLGLVLCAGQTIPNFPNGNRRGPFNGNRPSQFSSYRPQRPTPDRFPGFENCNNTGPANRRREPRVCMTNEETLTIREAARFLRANTTIGIRCPGCCPCTLRCPPAFIAGFPGAFQSGRN